MREQIILSCPFCHAKSEYQDAPPGSTVRCEECECIFRVPALHRRAPGGVVKGEAIRSSKKKLLVMLLVLVVLAAGGYFGWQKWMNRVVVDEDIIFAKLPYPLDTALGTLMRFLESWKKDDLPLMLRYCRTADQQVNPDREQAKKFEEWLETTFGNVKLTSYRITLVKPLTESVNEYPNVELTGEDTRTKAPFKGSMSPRVYLEVSPDAKARWGVDVRSATPIPE